MCYILISPHPFLTFFFSFFQFLRKQGLKISLFYSPPHYLLFAVRFVFRVVFYVPFCMVDLLAMFFTTLLEKPTSLFGLFSGLTFESLSCLPEEHDIGGEMTVPSFSVFLIKVNSPCFRSWLYFFKALLKDFYGFFFLLGLFLYFVTVTTE